MNYIFAEFPNKQGVWCNVQSGGFVLAHFPRFMLKRRRRCPNSTILLLFFPIFVIVVPSYMTKQALCTFSLPNE